MGTDKALMRVHGMTLIERAIQLIRSIGCSPKIVGSREDLAAYATVVADLHPGRGPLSGIEAGLLDAAGTSEAALFIPVDTPLLTPALLLQLLDRAWLTGALVTMPRSLGCEQPLCAVYHRDLLPAVSQALDAGDHKVTRVVKQAALALGGPMGVDIFDVETTMAAGEAPAGTLLHVAFLNCNTQTDFRIVEQQVH
jgi:molybdopterin-guanine dinucleotide biosynthesis protein A